MSRGAKATGPWPPRKATETIRKRAADDAFHIRWTMHAGEQIKERGLIMGDVLHVLKHGFVYEEGEQSTRKGLFKYKMESTTPNSNNRRVRVVVIPSPRACEAKIVSVMWVDEPRQGG